MNEHDALQVVLVQSFESLPADEQPLSEAERRHATRAALDEIGSEGPADAFIAARARAVCNNLARQSPAVERVLAYRGWHASWLLLAAGAGLLLGFTVDVLGGTVQAAGTSRTVGPVWLQVWLVILWNLAVYAVLGHRLWRRESQPLAGWHDWLTSAGEYLSRWRLKLPHHLAPTASPDARALLEFGAAWGRAGASLTGARLLTLLHVASAAVAVALIIGMYLRGLVLDYRIAWGSTFLEAGSIHALFSWLFAPAIWLSGIQLPDVAQLQALRDGVAVDRELASARRWIHLYAITLCIAVVLPRALLAGLSGWRARRLSQQFQLSLDQEYFRRLLRIRRGEPSVVAVLPYALKLDEARSQKIRRIVAQGFAEAPRIELAATTAPGEEDEPGIPQASLADATHLVALFDMRATPEAENHGAFLSALSSVSTKPLLIAVDESAFASRFRDYPQRIAERRDAWRAFAKSLRKAPLFFDLTAPQVNSSVAALRAAIDSSGER